MGLGWEQGLAPTALQGLLRPAERVTGCCPSPKVGEGNHLGALLGCNSRQGVLWDSCGVEMGQDWGGWGGGDRAGYSIAVTAAPRPAASKGWEWVGLQCHLVEEV